MIATEDADFAEIPGSSLLRPAYRALLQRSRSYAAFRKADLQLVQKLAGRGRVLDPMSGYGSLARFGELVGVTTTCVESNPPQYFWQILRGHQHREALRATASAALKCRIAIEGLPRSVASTNYFTPEGLHVLKRLQQILQACAQKELTAKLAADLSLAILLPFCGRLSCWSRGDISTRDKRGGICVFEGWAQSWSAYLRFLLEHVLIIPETDAPKQRVILGDARTVALGHERFRSMLTSPPYPNHRDFVTMFAPENELLVSLDAERFRRYRDAVIGSNFVRGKPIVEPTSDVVRAFLSAAAAAPRSQRAKSDDRSYYFPYLHQYFSGLESAYANISTYLSPEGFLGYLIVSNNTHRGLVVPVAEFLTETWRRLGFDATIESAVERHHVGTKNPRARGLRARHVEYVVRVSR